MEHLAENAGSPFVALRMHQRGVLLLPDPAQRARRGTRRRTPVGRNVETSPDRQVRERLRDAGKTVSTVRAAILQLSSYVFIDSLFLLKYFDSKITRMPESEQRVTVSNRKARHDYFILETIEAGIVLTGTEIKSIRKGNANLQDSYAVIRRGEVWVEGLHISPYEQGSIYNHDPRRVRKLLLQKKQIRKLLAKAAEQGMTFIPISIYFKGPYAKVELAIAKGKKSYDKREAIAKRDADRQIARLKRSRL
jgi:SsrA-binding protein